MLHPKYSSTDALEPIDSLTLTEHSCAKVFFHYFPDRFCYFGKRQWQYMDQQSGSWKCDKSIKLLKKCIRTEFSALILERAKYWQEMLHSSGLPHDAQSTGSHDISFRVMRLMEVFGKLQSAEFMKLVIRELAEWYHLG